MKRTELKQIIKSVIEESKLKGKVIEEAKGNYEKEITKLIEKSMKDELSSAIAYHKMSEIIEGYGNESDLAAHLQAHADDEWGHFKELLTYAADHGVIDKIKIEIDSKIIESPTDTKKVIAKVQELETTAFETYKEMATLAVKNEDIETYEFMQGLMNNEMGHFDDFNTYTGEVRKF